MELRVCRFSPLFFPSPARYCAGDCPVFRVAHRRRIRTTIPCLAQDDPKKDPVLAEEITELSPTAVITGSALFYGAMTAASIALGKFSHTGVLEEIRGQIDVTGSVIWLMPAILTLFISLTMMDRVPQLKRIQTILQSSLLPMLAKLPPWGPFILAFSAGIGEEAFFRGWMQPCISQTLSMLPSELPLFFGIFFSSLFFGLCHYITETYFLWATVFGALFGIESVQSGLPAAMLTHGLYDWIAFIVILEKWNVKNDDGL